MFIINQLAIYKFIFKNLFQQGNMKGKKKINNIANQIIKYANPLQIILFGSAVKGKMKKDSDIDFLVIMPNGTHKRKTAQMLYRKIFSPEVSFDIVVSTPDDLEKHKDNIGLIYKTILEEGKILYAA